MKKLFVILLVMLIALTACQTATPTESAAPTQAAGGPTAAPAVEATAANTAEPAAAAGPKELTIGLGQESYPQRGWAIETDDGFSLSYIGVLETLVKVDFDGNMVPSLAESYKQTDDTTWEFTLRQGISFTNGEPFNADAVVKSLNYIKNSPTPPRGITAKTFSSIEANTPW
jgi:peptide/nickel transport system substrate-binding protein